MIMVIFGVKPQDNKVFVAPVMAVLRYGGPVRSLGPSPSLQSDF